LHWGGGGVKGIVEGGDYRLELGLVFHLENGGIPLRRIITNEWRVACKPG